MITTVVTSSAGTARSDHRLPEDVVLVVLEDGTARLLDLAGNFYALTGMAARMLEETLASGADSACQSIVADYQADPEAVAHDLRSFLGELERSRLLLTRHSSRRSRAKAAFSWVTAPLVRSLSHPRLPLAVRVWGLLTMAYISTHLFGWTSTVRLWQRLLPGDRHTIDDPEALLAAIHSSVPHIIARHPLPMGCKERALTCWATARSAGLPARIQLGIDLFPLATHCWCECGPRILADRLEGNCDRYRPLVSCP